MGNNKKPFFRVTVADIRSPATGRFIETVGWYDPKMAGSNFKLSLERIEYWVAKGAQVSDSVMSLIKRNRRGEGLASAPDLVSAEAEAKAEVVETT